MRRAKLCISVLLALILLVSVVAFTASAEIAPGTGVSVAETKVTMDDGTKIAETVTVRCVREGANIPPPAPGAEFNFDYGGNSGIRVENDTTGVTYSSGGGWIKWANVDLKAGVASWKLCMASNGANRTFDIRISKPGEGLNNAVSLGTVAARGLNTGWAARWIRFPNVSGTTANAFIPGVSNHNNYIAPDEDPSWPTIGDSKLDGICDVYFVYPPEATQFLRLSLTLKETPAAPEGPFDGNVVFNASPAGAKIDLQNLVTGAKLTPVTGTNSFNNVPAGSYGYVASAPGYTSKIGTVEVSAAHTIAAPLIQNVLLWAKPAESNSLNLLSKSWDALYSTNTNGNPSWSNGSYVQFISGGTWFKWSGVDLKGGIKSWDSNIASGNAGNYSLEVFVAPTGSTPSGAALPTSATSLGLQTIPVASGGGWGAPGVAATYPATGELADPVRTGLSDVYVRCGGGDFNLGSVTLNLKPSDVIPAEVYNISIGAKPSSAAVTVKSLDGATTYKPNADGKTYSLDAGFYKCSATASGHIAKADQVFVVDRSKKVYIVLLPAGGVSNRFEAEAIAAADRPGSTVLVEDVQFSNAAAITLGTGTSNWATFSGITSEYSGIAEIKIGYSGVTSGYINVKPNNEAPRTFPLDASGVISVYMDVLDGANNIRISSVPAGFVLDYIDVWSLTTAGSVDPSETDEPYVWTKNPMIKSIYTADPEAHAWPTDPDRLMIYPSHDRYPQSGCDRMDMYHVFSTRDLIHLEDEGEILRRADLGDWAIKNTGLNAASFMWAPDAAYYDGYYYFYNPVPRNTGSWGSTWETSVVRSIYPDRDFEQIPAEDVDENPGKPFTGFLRDSGAMDGYANMYDVAVRVYDDRIYMYNGASQTLWQGELKSDMVTVVGGKLQLVSTNNQSTANNNGDPGAYRRLPDYHEGPSAFRRNGIYYLIYPGSSGTQAGMSGDSFHYATSDGPLGPWTHRGIFFNPHGTTTSHGSVVEFKGEYYWVYHTGNMLPNSSDQTRSVCMDKLVFDDDQVFADGTKGAIVRFTRTFDGVDGLDDVEYVAPTGTKYGPSEVANLNVSWGSGVTKNKDAAAENDGWVLSNVGGSANAASAVTLTFNLEKAQRARLRIHYSVTSDMPKLNLTVNGVDHNTVNFPRTGGRSFYKDLEYTPRKFQAGENTVVLGGAGAATSAQTGGSIRINYIEVIPLDEDEPTGIEVRNSGNHVSVVNYAEKDTDPAVTNIFFAVYNAKGALITIKMEENVSVDPKRAKTVIFDVDLSQYPGCSVKAFAWAPGTNIPIQLCEYKEIIMHNEHEFAK